MTFDAIVSHRTPNAIVFRLVGSFSEVWLPRAEASEDLPVGAAVRITCELRDGERVTEMVPARLPDGTKVRVNRRIWDGGYFVPAGSTGVVMGSYADGAGYEVEFEAPTGTCVLTLLRDDIEPIDPPNLPRSLAVQP